MLYVGVTRDSLDALHELITTLPAPQVCSHLYAYAGNDLLLEWTDVFDDPVYISGLLPEAKVAEFGDALGVSISQRPRGI
jgi:hypothetical protein